MNFVKFVIVAVVFLSQIEGTSLRPQVMTLQVPIGETATLVCESNDENHTFFYWNFPKKNLVIGPGHKYNNGKYKVEVLSGSLTIRAVSKEEEGIYECVSRGVLIDDLLIRPVQIVVQTDWEEVSNNYDPNKTFLRLTVGLLACFMILAGYRIWSTIFYYCSSGSIEAPEEVRRDEDKSMIEKFPNAR